MNTPKDGSDAIQAYYNYASHDDAISKDVMAIERRLEQCYDALQGVNPREGASVRELVEASSEILKHTECISDEPDYFLRLSQIQGKLILALAPFELDK